MGAWLIRLAAGPAFLPRASLCCSLGPFLVLGGSGSGDVMFVRGEDGLGRRPCSLECAVGLRADLLRPVDLLDLAGSWTVGVTALTRAAGSLAFGT